MEMTSVLLEAKRQLAEVTGLKPETVVRVIKEDDGWRVGLEMLEMTRIPRATDLLGEYEVHLSCDGGLMRFQRKGTHLRGEPTTAGDAT